MHKFERKKALTEWKQTSKLSNGLLPCQITYDLYCWLLLLVMTPILGH